MKKILSITTALASLVAFYGVNVLAEPLVEAEQSKQNVNKEVEQSKQKKTSRSNSIDEESDSEISRANKAKIKLEEREKRVCGKGDKGCGCKHDASFKEGPRITIGGGFNTQFYKTSDVEDYDVIPGDDKFANPNSMFGEFSNGLVGDYSKTSGSSVDTVLNVRAENTNYDLGLAYGADIKLNVPITKSGSMRSRSAHIFTNTEFGDINIGFMEGAESMMRLDASRIAAGDGGADSNWFKKANLEGHKGNFPFYVTPRLYSESLFSESNWLSFRDSIKYNKSFIDTQPFRVSYFSPSFMGLKAGVSYSPNYDSDLFSTGGMQKIKYIDPADKVGSNISANFTKKVQSIIDETIKATQPNIQRDTLLQIANAVNVANPNQVIAAERTNIINVVADAAFNIPVPNQDDVETAIRTAAGLDATDDVTAVANAAIDRAAVRPADAAALRAAIGGNAQIPAANTPRDAMVTAIIDDAIARLVTRPNDMNALRTAMDTHVISKMKFDIGTAKEFYTLLATSGNYVGPNYENIVSGGVSYEYDFDDFKVKVSATGEKGQVKEIKGDRYGMYGKYNDLMAFNLGLSAEYFGFKFAASYANLGKSGQPKEICIRDANNNKYDCKDDKVKGLQKDTYYWTAGAGYEFGNAYVSATYFKSKSAEANELSDIVIGAEYNLAPNGSKNPLTPYVTWHHFETKEKDLPADKKNNKGNIFLVGVKHSF